MKKISRILSIVLVLVLAVTGAGAEMATWQEVGTKVAPLEKAYGNYTGWDLETKMELIQLLEDLGELYDIDEVGTLLGEESELLTEEEKNTLCDKIMAAFVDGPVEAVNLNTVLETLHGKINSWSMRDRKWYTDLRTQNGINSEEDKNYVLPETGELNQDKATTRALSFLASMGAEHLSESRVDATLSEETENVYDEYVQVAFKGRRLWTIIFDPELDKDQVQDGGVCKVLMLASGPIVEYQMPQLSQLHMTGLLPAANGVSQEEVLATGREAIAEKLAMKPEELINLKVYYGYINTKDEVLSHAEYRKQLWVVNYPLLNTYAMLEPDGSLIYVQQYNKAEIELRKKELGITD